MSEWRFYAQRLITNEWLDRDLALRDVSITWALSGPGELTCTVDAVLAQAVGADGHLLLDEWSTAIYAELGDQIMWGGIVESSTPTGAGERSITAVSFSAYPRGRVYEGVTVDPPGHMKYYETDPFDIVRMLWNEAQYDPAGNIGVVVSQNTSGVVVGGPNPGTRPLRSDYTNNTDYENAVTQWQTNPSTPLELSWWNTPDIGDEIDSVMQEVLADYEEIHFWEDDTKNNVIHKINLYYPIKGRRRDDLRFVEGENIQELPPFTRDGENYANHIFAIGVGEDRSTLRKTAAMPDSPRVRRDKVYSNKYIMSPHRLQMVANELHRQSRHLIQLDSANIVDHPNAPIGSWALGDHLYMQTYSGFQHVKRWVRVVSWTINTSSPDVAQLTLTSTIPPIPIAATNAESRVPVTVVDPGQEPTVDGSDPVSNPEPPPEPAPSPDPAAPTNQLRIATYNIGDGPTANKVADMEKIAAQADMIGCQEGGDRGKAFNQFLKQNKDWAAYSATNSAQQSVTVLYRKTLGTIKVRANRLAVPATYVGPKGAGPSTIKPKYIMRVDIEMTETKRRIVILNTHFLPSVTLTESYLGTKEYKARRAHFKKHLAALDQYIDDCNGLVFITGDFNATPDFDLLNPFWPKANLDHNFNTHGDRRIDFVCHRPHAAISVVSTMKLTTSSDHDTPIVTYSIKSA